MDVDSWDDLTWKALTRSIEKKNCILLLGPDAATEEVSHISPHGTGNAEFRPCTELLANELANDVGEDICKWKIDRNDLPQVSQCYERKYKRTRLELKVESFYKAREHLTSTLHRDLAYLPFYLIITSTFDQMFLNALKEPPLNQLKQPCVDFHNFNRPRGDVQISHDAHEPLVYHLYGSTDDTESLVLTENNLLDLLKNVASCKAPLPDKIRTELREKDKSFLFLGFGFRHWYLRVLLHVLDIGSKEDFSFALEKIGEESVQEIDKTALYLENRGCNIRISQAELGSFTEKLKRKYDESCRPAKPAKSHGEKPPEVIKEPTVFISYARENSATAYNLESSLTGARVQTRIDKKSIGVGEDWPERINTLIKEADYFVIVLSWELHRRRDSEVWQELDTALKCHLKRPPGSRFILPVSIDDSPIPENLKRFQIHNLNPSASGSVNELLEAIKKDFEAQRSRENAHHGA